MDGVIRTRVGYAGGTTRNPAYHNLGNHAETVQIDYDPTKISYSELLALFWSSHDPWSPIWSRQYASIIFYHNEKQQNQALKLEQQKEAKLGAKITTEILPFTKFYLAEDYHQKYYLRQEAALFNEFKAIYPEVSYLINSTAVARVNGYLGGNGRFESLQKQIDSLGLSPHGQNIILQIGRRLLFKNSQNPRNYCS
jgi:methionine-S-sulfoxide reductase